MGVVFWQDGVEDLSPEADTGSQSKSKGWLSRKSKVQHRKQCCCSADLLLGLDLVELSVQHTHCADHRQFVGDNTY